ncbi:MAG: hypothetical protein WBN09_10715, partial [Woeseiaceae bacterium]
WLAALRFISNDEHPTRSQLLGWVVGCPRPGCSSSEWLASLRFISNDEHPVHRQLVWVGFRGGRQGVNDVTLRRWKRLL